MLTFDSFEHFEECVVLSLLTNRPFQITNTDKAGYGPLQKQFIGFILKLTHDTSVQFDSLSYSLTFQPGLLRAGEVSFSCGKVGIHRFGLPLLLLGIIAKKTLAVELKGSTLLEAQDNSNFFQFVGLSKVLEKAMSLPIDIKTSFHSFQGNSTVTISVKPIKLPSLDIIIGPTVSSISCIIYHSRLPSQLITRGLNACRKFLERGSSNVRIKSLKCQKDTAGSLAVVLESQKGDQQVHSLCRVFTGKIAVEDFCESTSHDFFDMIMNHHLNVRDHLWVILAAMAASPDSVSKLVVPFSPDRSVFDFVEAFFNVNFSVSDLDGGLCQISCLGSFTSIR